MKVEAKQIAAVEEFDKREAGILSTSSVAQVAAEAAKTAKAASNAPSSTAPPPPTQKMKCFWMVKVSYCVLLTFQPSVAPTASPSDVAKPCSVPQCPEGKHPLRLKKLVALQFSIPANQDISDNPAEAQLQRQCPVCLKSLTNTMQCALPKNCGHVHCYPCMQKLMDQGEAGSKCYVCGAPFQEKHIIKLQVKHYFHHES